MKKALYTEYFGRVYGKRVKYYLYKYPRYSGDKEENRTSGSTILIENERTDDYYTYSGTNDNNGDFLMDAGSSVDKYNSRYDMIRKIRKDPKLLN